MIMVARPEKLRAMVDNGIDIPDRWIMVARPDELIMVPIPDDKNSRPKNRWIKAILAGLSGRFMEKSLCIYCKGGYSGAGISMRGLLGR